MKATAKETIRACAVEIHNHTVLLGQNYLALQTALAEGMREAYHAGGEGAVMDFQNHAGAERVVTDLLGLMVASGLGAVLLQSRGRADHKPVINFADRFARLVDTGTLDAHRSRPSTNPLDIPGMKVHRT